MDNQQTRIAFLGAGAIGTALGNVLAGNRDAQVTLHSVETHVVDEINSQHINSKYFPTLHLHPRLKATTNNRLLEDANILFLAIPSVVLMDYLETIRGHIPPGILLVNLAKGFGAEYKTVYQCLRESLPNPACTLKGPGFARELIDQSPTGLTLAYESYLPAPLPNGVTAHNEKVFPHPASRIPDLFQGSNIIFDYSSDCQGVEILSILKNIYAVVMGIVDAQYNSPNLRFLVLTKAFREMRQVLRYFGGREETLFNYCGYGDFALTALNDLSRNRTLGLLIGKGFFTQHVSHDLVLEGKTAVNVFFMELSKEVDVVVRFPILAELFQIFNAEYDVSAFVNTILTLKEWEPCE